MVVVIKVTFWSSYISYQKLPHHTVKSSQPHTTQNMANLENVVRYFQIIVKSYNRRQNELRRFAQNWAFFLRFINFKRRKYSFPPPSPPCNVVPLF